MDAAVSEAMAAGGALYLTDGERLAALEPDLVISQDICDVCAVRGREAHEALPEGATMATLSATSIAGLADDLRRVGSAAGVDGEAAAERFLRELAAIAPASHPKRVLTLEWSDPPFIGGHWVPELVERAGGVNVLSEPHAPSRRIEPATLAAAEADLTLFLPCGYDLEAAAAEAETLPATLPTPLWACDANRLFSRCTPDALLGGLALIAAILRSESVDPAAARRTR